MTPFDVIVADPPWPFGDRLPGPGRGAEKHYKVMDVANICSFLVNTGVEPADNALLFMWRVSSMVEEAYEVVRAWGFVPKTELVWEKLTKNGKPHFGMGRIVRASHETCIIAARGDYVPMVQSKSVRSRFAAQAPREHSTKPPEFFAIVDELVGHDVKKIELFARERRPGWYAVGDEL